MTPRLEIINLYADGDRIRARCRLCGGELSRDTITSGWNLWDLWDAMGEHVAVNHPPETAERLTG